jgi:hypothetical protein
MSGESINRLSVPQPNGQATNIQQTERVERAIELISSNPKTTAIIKVLQAEFRVAERTAYLILQKARKQMMQDSKEDRQAWIAKGVAFYVSIITDVEQRTADRIKAFEGLRKLLGLDAPIRQQVEMSGADKYTDAELIEFARAAGIPYEPQGK